MKWRIIYINDIYRLQDCQDGVWRDWMVNGTYSIIPKEASTVNELKNYVTAITTPPPVPPVIEEWETE